MIIAKKDYQFDIPSSTAYNRAYLASRLRHSAQILLRRTSDTLGTLAAMPNLSENGNHYDKTKEEV